MKRDKAGKQEQRREVTALIFEYIERFPDASDEWIAEKINSERSDMAVTAGMIRAAEAAAERLAALQRTRRARIPARFLGLIAMPGGAAAFLFNVLFWRVPGLEPPSYAVTISWLGVCVAGFLLWNWASSLPSRTSLVRDQGRWRPKTNRGGRK